MNCMIYSFQNSSFRDSDTGLYNEAYFMEIFYREWHRLIREQEALSIVIIDPHLSLSNPQNKICFKALADTINSSTLRATDIVSRFHENEFIIGLFNLDEEGTETILQRITDNVTDATTLLTNSNVSASIGALHVLPSHDMNIESVLTSAEKLVEDLANSPEEKIKIEYYQAH